jgi:hypothetical protein
MENEASALNWDLYPDLIRLHTIGDGNCFFHAVLNAFSVEYKDSDVQGRRKLAMNIREKLAIELDTRYQNLSRGTLAEFSKFVPDYTLENMKSILRSNAPVDNSYNELISDVLDIDIYLLDNNSKKVYITGDDSEILHKGRKTVVLLVVPGHYDFVGIRLSDTEALTFFEPDHPLVTTIRKRA